MSLKLRQLLPMILLAAAPGVAQAAWGDTADRLEALEAAAVEAEERLTQLERVLEAQALLELMQDIETLRGEIRTLRSELEEVRHDLDGARSRQRDLYLDLDQRLQALERSGVVVSTPAAAAAGAAATNASQVSDSEAYQVAYGQLREGRYQEAAEGFQRFLGTYLDSPLRDNAQYWLGEAHYVTRNFEVAAEMFQSVLDAYPGSRKTADALLKLGFTQYELGDDGTARATLGRVIAEFPDSASANLAQQRLARMDQEGR